MIESIFTISIAGLLAGFIFSMPIAGPISVLIASNALKGRLRYCNLLTVGASFADFIYMFIAVFGLTKLYSLYEPAIPYIFAGGALLFIFLGYKIIKTKIDVDHIDDKNPLAEKIEQRHKGAFYTGFMINFLNPTLFIGAVTSSFFVISLIASMGFHTGGLATKVTEHVNEISNMKGGKIENSKTLSVKHFEDIYKDKKKVRPPDQTIYPASFHLTISIFYAFSLSLGTMIWFYLMSFLIVRFRQKININVISGMIKSLGVVLWLLAIYFGYQAVSIFSSL
jgi:threonine/homoserine/homoserine lactone efflux protein